MPLSFTLVRASDELARLRGAWTDLLARSADPEPTQSPDWLITWWRVFGDAAGRKLRVGLFYDGSRLIGMAPLLARTCWYRPGIPFRRIELLGSGEEEEDEILSEYIGLIAERGRETEVAAELVRALAGGRFGAWDELVCRRMNGEAPASRALVDAVEARGLVAEAEVDATSYYAPLPDSWQAYLQSLTSSRRYRVKRALRDFEKWSEGDYRMRRADDRESLERGLAILSDLHRERWSADGRRGVFASPYFRRFHWEVTPALLEGGALDLLWLEVSGEPVAALYNIVWDGRVHFYQSGRKMDLPKKIRPGTVAHAFAIQRSIEAGRREYDFLAGDSRYKEELGPAVRELLALRVTRSFSLREGARRLARRGVHRAREAKRALREKVERR